MDERWGMVFDRDSLGPKVVHFVNDPAFQPEKLDQDTVGNVMKLCHVMGWTFDEANHQILATKVIANSEVGSISGDVRHEFRFRLPLYSTDVISCVATLALVGWPMLNEVRRYSIVVEDGRTKHLDNPYQWYVHDCWCPMFDDDGIMEHYPPTANLTLLGQGWPQMFDVALDMAVVRDHVKEDVSTDSGKVAAAIKYRIA